MQNWQASDDNDLNTIQPEIQSFVVNEAYALAQDAMSKLRTAVYLSLEEAPNEGLKNAEIGRALGVYSGHVGHEGHISRTILALMEAEGVVEQNPETKSWHLRSRRET